MEQAIRRVSESAVIDMHSAASHCTLLGRMASVHLKPLMLAWLNCQKGRSQRGHLMARFWND